MPAYLDRGLVGRTVQALQRLIAGGTLPPAAARDRPARLLDRLRAAA